MAAIIRNIMFVRVVRGYHASNSTPHGESGTPAPTQYGGSDKPYAGISFWQGRTRPHSSNDDAPSSPPPPLDTGNSAYKKGVQVSNMLRKHLRL